MQLMELKAEEAMEARYQEVVEQVRKTYKADYIGVVPVEFSVQKQIGLIEQLSAKDSGAFLSYDGSMTYL